MCTGLNTKKNTFVNNQNPNLKHSIIWYEPASLNTIILWNIWGLTGKIFFGGEGEINNNIYVVLGILFCYIPSWVHTHTAKSNDIIMHNIVRADS